eukprot:XP_001697475.1 predicted protein [Chlamydomonas reinhardtii]
MSAAGKAENTEAAAAAEPGPPVSWDLGVDITVAIANLITEENSPFFDEADIASVAASCMCVGHPTFTSIAEILYQFLSPRFGDDPGVSEGSSVGELKAVLKSWGRPCTGKKSELWSRILDEAGRKRAADAATVPAAKQAKAAGDGGARGPKRRIIELQNARVTKSRAKEVYGLYQSLLQELPTRLTQLQAFGGFRAETYALKDVKRLAVKNPPYDRAQEEGNAKERVRSQRQNMVKDILMRRGVAADAAEAAVNHVWHLDFFTAGVQYGAEAPVAMEPEWLRLNSEAAADEAHTYIFHVQHTNFRSHLANLRATHTYARSGSKYRQDVALEKRAFAMALQEWVAGRRLEDLVADARLPPHMRPAAEQALRAVADGSAAAERERLPPLAT